MKIKEYKETIKKGEARTLWKQHMNNEIYLTNKQLEEVLKLKDKRR